MGNVLYSVHIVVNMCTSYNVQIPILDSVSIVEEIHVSYTVHCTVYTVPLQCTISRKNAACESNSFKNHLGEESSYENNGTV